MHLDVRRLKEMHPRLLLTTVNDYAMKVAVCFDRHGHAPGVVMRASYNYVGVEPSPEVHWTPSEPGAADVLDAKDVTAHAAEALALALVHHARGWVVRRRLQEGESVDWLLSDRAGNLVALEVSGVNKPDNGARLRSKLDQARRCTIRAIRAACVVTHALPESSVVEV